MDDHESKPAILLVEDDPALCRLFVTMLTNGGFTPLAAGQAADGLSLVRQRRGAVALAIVDMMMPGMSGLDLATELDREYPHLKILYISGYVDSIAAAVLSRRSPEHVLLKPFSEPALLQRVRLLLATPLAPQPARASEPSAQPTPGGMLS
jgi:CheY-like chemotaxis protein